MSAMSAGDAQALAILYDRHSQLVYSVALRVLGDTGRAEDVLQDIFMRLWRRPNVYDQARGNLGAWLAVIGRNRAIDVLRKHQGEADIEGVIVSLDHDVSGQAERSRAMQKILALLASMPSSQRSALEMAYFQGLTHTEISQRTGEPLGTVKTRIRTGLMSLRKAFSQ